MPTEETNIIIRFLLGEASPEEAHKLDQLLNSSTECREEFNRIWELWNSVEKRPGYKLPELEREWNALKSRLDGSIPGGGEQQVMRRMPGGQRSVFRPFAFVGLTKWLMIVCAVVVSSILFVVHVRKSDSTKSAQPGVVPSTFDSVGRDTLSTPTISRMDNRTSIRDNSLFSGTAYFQGKPGDRPFTIKAGGLKIAGAGAKYLVILDSVAGKLTIQVFEGGVEVSGDSGLQRLEKGHSMEYDVRAGRQVILNAVDSNAIAFSTGIYSFRNEPLREIAELLSMSYHVTIKLKNPAIGNCRLTGQFDNLSIEEL